MSRFLTICMALFLLVTILTGCGSEVDKQKPEVRPVRTVIVDPKPIEDDQQAIGDIRPRYETALGFRVAGKLISRSVDIGDEVKKGDVLAQLDEQDFKIKIRAAEADVTAAQAVFDEAIAAEKRMKSLLDKRVTSRATYDSALRTMRTSKAQLTSAKAALALAQDQLAYAKLDADFDGIVTGIGAEPGQVIAAGQLVVKLAKPEEKDAVFNIAESAFRNSKPDERPKILVSLLSNPAIKANGIAREVSPVADPATRTYQVKITLKNPPYQMRFGASVLGRLETVTAPVIVLPASALFDKGGKPAVWIFNPISSQVNLKEVDISRYESGRIIINTGLNKGDIVVTAGVNRLREKQTVRLLAGAK